MSQQLSDVEFLRFAGGVAVAIHNCVTERLSARCEFAG